MLYSVFEFSPRLLSRLWDRPSDNSGYTSKTTQKKADSLASIFKGIKALWRRYYICMRLVADAKQLPRLLLVVLFMIPQFLIPTLILEKKSLWVQALMGKSVGAWAIGSQLVSLSMLGLCIQIAYSIVVNSLAVEVAQNLREKVQNKMRNQESLSQIQQQEARNKQAIGDSGVFLSQTLSREGEDFIRKFIKLHNIALFLTFWVVQASMSLYAIGMFPKALALASCALIAAAAIAYTVDIKGVSEQEKQSRSGYDHNMQIWLKQARIGFYPNLNKQVQRNLSNYSQKIKFFGWWRQFYNDFIQTLSMTLYKSIEPLIMMGMFLAAYLESTMSYNVLRSSVGMVVELFGAASIAMYFLTEVTELKLYADHILGVYEGYVVNSEVGQTATFRGLSAVGSCELVKENELRVLKFTAQLVKSPQAIAFKRYGTEKEALSIPVGGITGVFGINGSGKSLFFDSLSGVIPGLTKVGLDEKRSFALYCMQVCDDIVEREAGEPWTPMQLLTLLWPFQIAKTAEEIDEDRDSLIYFDINDVEQTVTYQQLRNLLDAHLQQLRFCVDGITDVQGLKEGKKDFFRMSGGQKKKLRLALYLTMLELIQPRIFLVDEPTNDLDQGARKAWKAIKECIRKKCPNTAVLIVDHESHNQIGLTHYDSVCLIEDRGVNNIAYFGRADEYGDWNGKAIGQMEEDGTLPLERMSAH